MCRCYFGQGDACVGGFFFGGFCGTQKWKERPTTPYLTLPYLTLPHLNVGATCSHQAF